jgi:hypothetical protein
MLADKGLGSLVCRNSKIQVLDGQSSGLLNHLIQFAWTSFRAEWALTIMLPYHLLLALLLILEYLLWWSFSSRSVVDLLELDDGFS